MSLKTEVGSKVRIGEWRSGNFGGNTKKIKGTERQKWMEFTFKGAKNSILPLANPQFGVYKIQLYLT